MKTTHYKPPTSDKQIIAYMRQNLLLPMRKYLSRINIRYRDQRLHIQLGMQLKQEQAIEHVATEPRIDLHVKLTRNNDTLYIGLIQIRPDNPIRVIVPPLLAHLKIISDNHA